MNMLVKFNSKQAADLYSNKFEPTRKGDAGYDLRIDTISDDGTIGTGVLVAIPDGYVGLVMPRGGLGFKYGIELMNTVGVIDCNYRGEILARLGAKDGHVLRHVNPKHDDPYIAISDSIFLEDISELSLGDRFAQMVVVPYSARSTIVDELPDTNRGTSGFGSSGVQ